MRQVTWRVFRGLLTPEPLALTQGALAGDEGEVHTELVTEDADVHSGGTERAWNLRVWTIFGAARDKSSFCCATCTGRGRRRSVSVSLGQVWVHGGHKREDEQLSISSGAVTPALPPHHFPDVTRCASTRCFPAATLCHPPTPHTLLGQALVKLLDNGALTMTLTLLASDADGSAASAWRLRSSVAFSAASASARRRASASAACFASRSARSASA